MSQISDHVTPGAPVGSLCYDHVLAVVCGVSDYSGWRAVAEHDFCHDLPGVKHNVDDMTQWLEKAVGAEIVSLPDSPDSRYHPANATAVQIAQLIECLRQRLARECTIGRRIAAVVYLAGHGRKRELGSVPQLIPEPLSDRGYRAKQLPNTGHFLAARIKPDAFTTRDEIPFGRICGEFAQSLAQAHHRLFILDCCWAGLAVIGHAGGATKERVLNNCLRHRGAHIVCASGRNRRAPYDESGLVFTRLFLDAVGKLDGRVVPISHLIPDFSHESALEHTYPRVTEIEPSEGEFLVGLPTRQQLLAAPAGARDKRVREAVQQFARSYDFGVRYTKTELSAKLREQGLDEREIESFYRNNRLKEKSDDYLYLEPPPTGSSREQHDE